MSGVEIIGLISAAIAIVNASLRILEAGEDISGLPPQFRNVAARLPAIHDTLETERAVFIEEEEGEDPQAATSREVLSTVLESCLAKATSLDKTLQAAISKESAPSIKRYIKALKSFPNADKVDGLMNDNLHDIQMLVANRTAKSATRIQARSLSAMIKKSEKRENINVGRRATITLYNAGLGSQFGYEGHINQNVSTGKGLQINWASTPFHITLATQEISRPNPTMKARDTKNAPLYMYTPPREIQHYQTSAPNLLVETKDRPEWFREAGQEQSHPPLPKGADSIHHQYVARPSDRRGFEVAIICALVLEYDAFSLVFDQFWDEKGDFYGRAAGDENAYTTGCIGKFNVVLVLLSHTGKASAADAAASVRGSYPGLRLALLVGICGGVPQTQSRKEIVLGDVIIGSTIVQYDFGKQYPNQFVRKSQLNDDIGGPNKDIRNLLTLFSTRRHQNQLQKRTAFFLRQLQTRATEEDQEGIYNYLRSTHDQLFAPGYRHKHHISPECICRHYNTKADAVCESVLNTLCSDLERLESKRRLEESNDERAQEPALYIGAIASGDTVMKSGEHRDEIARTLSEDVLAFEKESAGVSEAFPCIVVKGVSDYADSLKNNMWQNFAAATAAAASKAILERYIQSDKLV